MVQPELFKKTGITPADFCIIIFVLLTASALLIFGAGGGNAEVCVVEVDGKEIARYDLLSLKDEQIVKIDNEFGKNTVVIDKNGAAVTDSNCEDSIEVKAGKITKAGQSLICLPHRLIVRLEGGESDGVSW